MAKTRVRINRTYNFIDKDPVIYLVADFIKERGLEGEYYKIAQLASISPSTPANWIEGDVRMPRHASLASVVTGLGGRFVIVSDPKRNEWDIDKELEKAKRWLAEYKPRKKKPKPRKKRAKKK